MEENETYTVLQMRALNEIPRLQGFNVIPKEVSHF